jgi:hypothetical protein
MTLTSDIARSAVDFQLVNDIVHGTAAEDVTTDGGIVPTFAKMLTNLGLGVVKGAWVTATAYALGDVVTNGGAAYRCVLAHTSGATFAGDLATKWVSAAAVSVAMQPVVTASTLAAGRASMGPWEDISAMGMINVMDPVYGVAGDGTTDDTAALQDIIDYVQTLQHRPKIVFPARKYKTTSTLTITGNNVSLFGLGAPSVGRGDDSSNTTRGPCIRYYGSGTAVLVGVNPGVNGSFIYDTKIENMRIETDNNCACALKVWHGINGVYRNISIFGAKGAGTVGIQTNGGVNNLFDLCFIQGIGQTPGATESEYMEYGIRALLGYLNEPATTTTFRGCYINYVKYVADITTSFNFIDTIFETCVRAITSSTGDIKANFTRCWFEDCDDIGYMQGFNGAFTDCSFNIYEKQYFFSCGTGMARAVFNNCRFASTHATPYVFTPDAMFLDADSYCDISGCWFSPSNILLGGGAYSYANQVRMINMRKHEFSFVSASQAANTTVNPIATASGLTAFKVPEKGHAIGVAIYPTSTLGAGTYSWSVNKNGSEIVTLSSTQFGSKSAAFAGFTRHMQERVSAGDVISVSLTTSAGLTPNPSSFAVDVIMAYGSDGTDV